LGEAFRRFPRSQSKTPMATLLRPDGQVIGTAVTDPKRHPGVQSTPRPRWDGKGKAGSRRLASAARAHARSHVGLLPDLLGEPGACGFALDVRAQAPPSDRYAWCPRRGILSRLTAPVKDADLPFLVFAGVARGKRTAGANSSSHRPFRGKRTEPDQAIVPPRLLLPPINPCTGPGSSRSSRTGRITPRLTPAWAALWGRRPCWTRPSRRTGRPSVSGRTSRKHITASASPS
jgi:hypothetical protein